MCCPATFTRIKYIIMLAETLFKIVGIQYSHFRSTIQSLSSHHLNIGIRYRQDACTAPRSRRYCFNTLTASRLNNWASGKKGSQFSGTSDRPNARPTAAVRNTKCFVKVQMANIRPNFSRISQPDLCIQISPIQIYQSSIFVDYVAYFFNFLLKNAVSRGIGYHECG